MSYESEKAYIRAEREITMRDELAAAMATPVRLPWHFAVASDIVVVGQNPEMSDMDNPRGNILRERYYYMTATNERGYRKAWGFHDSPESLEQGFLFVAPPVDEWADCRPAYGSEAYEIEGCEEEYAAQERDDALWEGMWAA